LSDEKQGFLAVKKSMKPFYPKMQT